MACQPVTRETVFTPVPLHFKVPHGLFLLEATSCAVDSEDSVCVLRTEGGALTIR